MDKNIIYLHVTIDIYGYDLYSITKQSRMGVIVVPFRLKYPEAPAKRNHYNRLVNDLTADRNNIELSVNGARTITAASIDPANVDGEYYNQYITKCNDWINIHGQQIAIFDAFLPDIDVCIANASKLAALWDSRIGVMEEYDV